MLIYILSLLEWQDTTDPFQMQDAVPLRMTRYWLFQNGKILSPIEWQESVQNEKMLSFLK